MNFCSIIALVAADTASNQSPLSANDTKYQTACMHRALPQSMGFRSAAVSNIYKNHAHKDKPCEWTGMGCHYGLLTKCVVVHVHVNLDIDTHWLPPSVQFLHLFEATVLSPLIPERLPRDLRYLCFFNCRSKRHGATYTKFPRTLDFSKLPPKMEELHIDRSVGLMCGAATLVETVLVLKDLPETLRILQINTSVVHRVYIDWYTMPWSLDFLSLRKGLSMDKKSIVEVGKAVPHLEISFNDLFVRGVSTLLEADCAEAQAIRTASGR